MEYSIQSLKSLTGTVSDIWIYNVLAILVKVYDLQSQTFISFDKSILVGFLCKWINCVQYFQLKLLAFYGRFILYLVINIVDSMSVKSVWIIVSYRLLLIVTIFVFPAIKIILVKPVKLIIRYYLLSDYCLRHWCFSFALGAKRKEYVRLWLVLRNIN